MGEIRLDWRIALYTLACSIAATLVCGLLPALRGTQRGISQDLAQANRTQVSGRNPLQWTLVGVQVALAVTLLAGAGLLVRSFRELGRVSPGFDSSHVLTLHISATWGETADMKGLTQRIDRILDSVRNLPGVEGAATAASLPGVPDKYENEVRITGAQANPNEKMLAESRYVSTGYFGTMRIPLLEGELCRQVQGSVCVNVNRSFVNAYLAGSPAVGHHVEVTGYFFYAVGHDSRGCRGCAGGRYRPRSGSNDLLVHERSRTRSILSGANAWRTDGDGEYGAAEDSRNRTGTFRVSDDAAG